MEEAGGGQSPTDLVEDRYLGLSPPNHPQRQRLTCIQQSIFADSDSPLIGPDEKRGIELLGA